MDCVYHLMCVCVCVAADQIFYNLNATMNDFAPYYSNKSEIMQCCKTPSLP